MELRPLGRSDIKVSAIGLGVMTFGAQTGEDDAFRQLDMAFEAGINFFDTAENYPSPITAETQGRSEEMLGKWIASRGVRDRVIVATKVTGPGQIAGDMSHIRGVDRKLDRANIEAAIEGSLRRLGADYVDLYQVHWPHRPITTLSRTRFSHLPDTPDFVTIEDTVAALGEIVKAGKARTVGVANESPWGVMRYLASSEKNGAPRIASIQNSYSMLDRYFEIGLAEIAVREHVGLIAHSPLAGGVLTNKYAKAEAIEGSRSALSSSFVQGRLTPGRMRATQAYAEIARRHGLSPVPMALAFVKQKPFTTSVLAAASSATQLQGNLAAIDLVLSKDALKEIDAVHDANPNPK